MARSIFYDSLKRILFAFFAMMFVAPVFSATLPAGYTELEYVTFDGTSSTGAYVDTGLKYYTDVPNNKVRLVADAKVYQGSGWQVVVGSIGSVSAYVGTNSSNYFYYSIGFADTNTNVMNPYQRSEFDLNAVAGTYVIKNKVTGTTMVNISNIQPIAKTTDYPILVGGFQNASGMRPERTHMDLYSVKVYNNGNLVFDGIPCKSPDNKIGIYDTVSNSFKTTPSGINTLTAGPAIQTYTMLEYIESTGTQYIDTGVTDITNSEFGLVAQQTVIDTSGYPTILGAMDGGSYKVLFGYNSASRFYSQPSTGYITTVLQDTAMHTFKLVTNQNSIFTMDGVDYTVNDTPTSSTTNALYLCARNRGNGTVNSFTKQKVYSFYVKKNGTLVRDMKPARRDSDGRVGMLDTVNNVFYDNAASTTVNFEAGPDLPEVTIKIATTKYNEDAFADLITTLNSAITKVTNIVDTTVAQASSIGTLATTKQDRPADGDCPAGRKCLLVTGTDGKPHWYLIQE